MGPPDEEPAREHAPTPDDPTASPSASDAPRDPSGESGSPGVTSAREPSALGWFLLVSFLLNFSQGVYPPLLPEVVDELGLSLAAAGLLGTAFSLPRSLLALPAGMLVERLGPARMLHAGMALVVTGTLIPVTASSLAAMAVARACTGLGHGATAIVGITYLMRSGPAHQRTRRGNMYEGALISANAVSGYLAGSVSVLAGWRWGFGAAAVTAGAGWMVAARRVVPAVRDVLGGPGVIAGPLPPASPAPAVSAGALPAIYLVAFALSFAWAGAITTLAPLYGAQALGLSAAAIGQALALGYIVEAGLLLPVGWAADTFGRLRVLLPGLGVLVGGVALLPLSGGLAGYTLACGLIITGMTVWMIPASLLAEHLRGRFGPRTIGVYRFVTDAGMVLAPVLIGWLTGRRGFGAGAGVVAAVLAGAGTVAAIVLGTRRGRRPPVS